MPIYQKPRSDDARMSFMRQAKITAEQDIAAGNPYISQSLIDEISILLPNFETKLIAINKKLSGRAKEVREQQAAIEKLSTYTRDLWAVLKRRVYRLNEPAEVFSFYQLPLDGVTPNLTTNSAWLTIAKKVIEGDVAAVAAGYDAIENPTALEVNEMLTIALAEYDDVAIADRKYDEAQEEIADLRAPADSLIQEVMDELRFTLRKKDAPSQRRIMRTYGATFSFAIGEPGEETELGTERSETSEAN